MSDHELIGTDNGAKETKFTDDLQALLRKHASGLSVEQEFALLAGMIGMLSAYNGGDMELIQTLVTTNYRSGYQEYLQHYVTKQ